MECRKPVSEITYECQFRFGLQQKVLFIDVLRSVPKVTSMLKYFPKFFAFLSAFVLFTSNSFGQDSKDGLSEAVSTYSKMYPWERVYLHTDKPHYELRDTIWIKAYAILEDGSESIGRSKSVPLYVDLIDRQFNRLVDQIIIKLDSGSGRGDIVLPSDLRSGVYSIRSYTNWMKNFGQDAFFEKNIWIGPLGEAIDQTRTNPKLDLKFFPEGGYLVEGIRSRVGFKASNELGKGVDVIGFVLNAKSDTVHRFESEHLGMGSFEFTPKKGEKYEVKARTANGFWETFNFSKIEPSGFTLGINATKDSDNIHFEIRHSNPDKQTSADGLILVGLSRGRVVYQKELAAKDSKIQWSAPKEDFLPGMVTFTLMDDQTHLLAERLVYFHPFAQGTMAFMPDKDSYRPKEGVELQFEIKDEFGSPIEGEFSVAVIDDFQVTYEEGTQNIFSYLHLVSEVKGTVEMPYYYFNPENKDAEKHLDNLLLTQGWRRFAWNHLSRLENGPEFGFEPGLSLLGNVHTVNGKPVKQAHNLTVLLNNRYGMPLLFEGVTDDSGNFAFVGLEYQDSVRVYLQAFVEKEKKSGEIKFVKSNEATLFEIEIPMPPIGIPQDLGPVRGYEDFNDYLVMVKDTKDMLEQFRLNQEILLGEVTVSGRRSTLLPDKRTIQYNNEPDGVFAVTEEFYSYQNVFQVLRGRFPGVDVRGDVFDFMNPPSILIRGGVTSIVNAGGGATLLLDGMIATPQMIATIPVAEIERIDVLRGLSKGAVYGADGAGGVVNVLTKSGNPNRDFSKENILGNATLLTKGYAPIREFYTPSAIPDITAPIAIDFRSTIYWQPMVQTDAYGKGMVSFRLTEGNPQVRVLVEGLSKDNEPVFGSYTFKVK